MTDSKGGVKPIPEAARNRTGVHGCQSSERLFPAPRFPLVDHRHRVSDLGLACEVGSLLDPGQLDCDRVRRIVLDGFLLAPKHDYVHRGDRGAFGCLSKAGCSRVSDTTLVETCVQRSRFGIDIRGVLEVLPPQNHLPGCAPWDVGSRWRVIACPMTGGSIPSQAPIGDRWREEQ
jgi:hypothetical protein